MLKYIIAKKYKYLKYYKICLKKCRKLKPKPKPKQYPNPNSTQPDIYRFLIVCLFNIY